MRNIYENHAVVASFDLGMKPGQIMAVSTFKKKITEIERIFGAKDKLKTTLIFKQLQNFLIEEIKLEFDDKTRLIVKNGDQINLELVVDDTTNPEKLAEVKIGLISKINSLHDLRRILSNQTLTYEQLEKAILKTPDPIFLKETIRHGFVPSLKVYVDEEVFKISSFEIPNQWIGGEQLTLTDYVLHYVSRDGRLCASLPDDLLPNKPLNHDKTIMLKVDTSTIEYETLKLASNMNLMISVDVVKIKKAKWQCPHFKVVKLHKMDEILKKAKHELFEFQEKLNLL